jgi:lysophospholipid acyltransferase (LPLAT)-like uncharacterized protein
MKKLLSSTLFQWLVAFIVFLYCLLLRLTCRTKIIGKEHFTTASQPNIIAGWHGKLLLFIFVMTRKEREKLYGIISKHGDGDLIAKLSALWKIKTIRGSTNRTSDDPKGAKDRGGQKALRDSLKALKTGNTIGYTPDGPRGPRMQINEISMLTLAQRTQASIIPLTFSAQHFWKINSWDQFIIPKPFSKIHVIIDTPIPAPQKGDEIMLENTRKTLEDRLNIISHTADLEMGNTPIAPMPRT